MHSNHKISWKLKRITEEKLINVKFSAGFNIIFPTFGFMLAHTGCHSAIELVFRSKPLLHSNVRSASHALCYDVVDFHLRAGHRRLARHTGETAHESAAAQDLMLPDLR